MSIRARKRLVIGLLLVVGAASDSSPWVGVLWGVLAALFAGVTPYVWVLLAVRRGRFSSRHIPERGQRLLPLGVAAVSVAFGVGLLVLLGAPRELVALIVAMLAGLAVTAAVTTQWKISLHTAVAAGTSVILVAVFVALPAGVGWSRVHLRAHTLPQVIAGAVLGAATAAAVFIPLR